MAIKLYVKKPIPIKALQWFLDTPWEQIESMLDNPQCTINFDSNEKCLLIGTLEGTMKLTEGNYLIRGIKGEVYPCDKEIFEQSYDLYSDEEVKPTISYDNEIGQCEDCGC